MIPIACARRNIRDQFVLGAVSRSLPDVVYRRQRVAKNFFYGLYFRTGTPGQLPIDHFRFEHNTGNGIKVHGGGASITRTVAAGNGSSGIAVSSGAKANISWTSAEHNGYDGYALGAGHMTLEQSVARGNGRYPGTAVVSGSVLTNKALASTSRSARY